MSSRMQTVLKAIPESDALATLYLPKPIIQVGGEKWRILRKSAVDAMRDAGHDALANRIEDMELDEFRGAGRVFFTAGNTVQSAHLSSRPMVTYTNGGIPFLLPLFADLASATTDWIVEINREKPKLFLRTGETVVDMTDQLDAPTYEEIRERREVQDDVIFHSASRGPRARVNYHALGADQSQEEEKTNESYYRVVWDAVENAVPEQIDRLTVVGAGGTVGRFIEVATTDRFEIVPIRSGDGVEAVPQRAPKWPNGEDIRPSTIPDAVSAANEGRLGTLVVALDRLDHPVLLDAEGDNERVSFHREIPEMNRMLNELLVKAAGQGAEIYIHSDAGDHLDGDALIGAAMRW
ncbi:MAG: hypothetical protein AAFQ42_13755 [Pseudomonadota bacterium]